MGVSHSLRHSWVACEPRQLWPCGSCATLCLYLVLQPWLWLLWLLVPHGLAHALLLACVTCMYYGWLPSLPWLWFCLFGSYGQFPWPLVPIVLKAQSSCLSLYVSVYNVSLWSVSLSSPSLSLSSLSLICSLSVGMWSMAGAHRSENGIESMLWHRDKMVVRAWRRWRINGKTMAGSKKKKNK